MPPFSRTLLRRGLWMLAFAVFSCGSPQRAERPHSEDGDHSVAPASAAPIRQPPAEPLIEDEHGIAGAPRDDTGFDFEPEVADEVEDLVVEGVEPASSTVLRTIGGYLDVRRARLASVSADGKNMLVLTRLAETTQAHLVSGPLMARQQVTFGPDPAQQVSFVPKDATRVTYRVDHGGDERFQVVSLNLHSRRARLLSDGSSRHGPFRWSPMGTRLAFTRTLDAASTHELLISNGRSPGDWAMSLSGEWVTLGWSRDESRILLQQFWSAAISRMHIAQLSTGQLTTIDAEHDPASYDLALFTNDPKVVLVTSNRDGDFIRLYRHNLETGEWKPLSSDIPWDVEEVAVAPDGKLIVFSANEDGMSSLWMLVPENKKPTRLDIGARGVVSELRFTGPGRRLAFTLARPDEPSDVFTFDMAKRTLVRWTMSETGGLDPKRFITPELIRYGTFDGLKVPAYVYRPRDSGPHPVLIWVHGGPEEQFRPAFDPIIQYLVARGIAVVAPNIRGSAGYGKTYLSLDDGVKRKDAVKDIGALLDWLRASPDFDAERVGIHGASYGGFIVLAALVEYPHGLVAGCDVVGISNIVTFLENTRGYRRDLRRAEYGDERDPAVRARLVEISPLSRAENIRSALFVAHGMRDPRVPASEAERIVHAVRAAGNDVWYMVAPNEGHSFRQRRNRDALYRSMATFFEKHLLERADPPSENPPPSIPAPSESPPQTPTVTEEQRAPTDAR